MPKLTKRQQEVLELVEDYVAEHSSPPTRVEIAKLMGFRSPNAAEDHLKALAKKGAIDLIPGTSRGIRLASQAGLPVINHISPEKPILSPENIEQTYKIDKTLFQPNAHFLFRIPDDSMVNAGIAQGDLLVAHITHTAHNNQIMVVRRDNKLLVRRYHQERSIVILSAQASNIEPVKIDLEDEALEIEGIAVGVIKTKI